ncbi:glycoside hydrolase [Dyadobacter sp. NIV53]|uniref:WD40/YVTN/BNR-like repeat-containing protein n=1 Tax=Dyadobacter sp. NIV53 TaxID=2861765 RepID=UPI001C86E4EF|nr:glycoside hydrolase [Dyadobacter sp. NIV53]
MKIKSRKNIVQAFLFITLLSVTASCNNDDNDNDNPQPGTSTLIDHGYIPVTVDGHSEFASNEFQLAAYNNNFVFVATSDGLWKNNLTTKEWSRSGFEGKKVSCIFRHPTVGNKLFAGIKLSENATEKSLFISNDGGITWTAAESPVHNDLDNIYETYVSMAVRPNNPDHIYANLEGGAMIAVSTDGGKNWKRMNNAMDSYFGYQSNIVFLPNNSSQIFQGSENPLDDAWLGRYDIDAKNPVLLSNFTKVVDMSVFGNRRPVELQTNAYSGNSIYVGQEGALTKVTGTTTKFIFKADEENAKLPYAYIYGIWVDPNDTNHILFGGAINGDQTSLSLFETFDEGKAITQLTGSSTLANAEVRKIVATNTYPAIVVYEPGTKKTRLLLYKSK